MGGVDSEHGAGGGDLRAPGCGFGRRCCPFGRALGGEARNDGSMPQARNRESLEGVPDSKGNGRAYREVLDPRFVFVEKMPLTSAGKLDKALLRGDV